MVDTIPQSCIVYLFSYLSSKQAVARPPSAQAASKAKRWFSLCNLLLAVVTSRPPVAPKGWPMEREPPRVFILSMLTEPTGLPPGKRSAANLADAIAVRFDNTWPAKAVTRNQ